MTASCRGVRRKIPGTRYSTTTARFHGPDRRGRGVLICSLPYCCSIAIGLLATHPFRDKSSSPTPNRRHPQPLGAHTFFLYITYQYQVPGIYVSFANLTPFLPASPTAWPPFITQDSYRAVAGQTGRGRRTASNQLKCSPVWPRPDTAMGRICNCLVGAWP